MMKRASLLGISLSCLLACGGAPPKSPEPAPPAPPAPPAASTTPRETVTERPVASAEAPLPPPKPSTLALARTGDAKLDALLTEGDVAFEAEDYAKAQAAYEAARKAFPKVAAPIVGVARTRAAKATPTLGFAAAEKNAEVVAASKELKRATTMDASYGPAFVELGRALLLLGDGAGAQAALTKGVALLPQEAEAHSALGVALLSIGRGKEAVEPLTRARDLDPGSGARRGNLGTVLFMNGRVAEAVKEYEAEARIAPDEPRAHSDLGTALLAQSDFARAVPELRRAVALDPKRATFRSNLGYALQLEGKLAEAIAEYKEATALDPKLASAWINLATALAREPKTREEARRALLTAQTLDPTDPRVKANLEELDALK